MYKKIIFKNILIIFFSIFFFIFVLEISTRFFFSVIKTDLKYFFYGFNNNINIKVNSLTKLEIYINDSSEIKKSKKELLLPKQTGIFVFGGSTSRSYCDAIPWPSFLEKKKGIKINNFARSGKNSDYSFEVLISQLGKQIPESVIWAHKANEFQVAYFGLDRNKDKISFEKFNFKTNYHKHLYFLKAISLTFKKYLVSYYMLDEIILRIQYKFGKVIVYQNIISDENLEIASFNYKINTLDAIRYSFLRGVKNFYIISLFNKYDLENYNDLSSLRSQYDKKFEIFFNKRVNEILNEYKNSNVYYINTLNLIKKNLISKEISKKKLFCDNDTHHHSTQGHELISDYISSFIK